MKFDSEVQSAIARWAPVFRVSIPPALVHAIIEKESSHRALGAIRESGLRTSYGPMAVLDSTARGLGYDPPTLKDPARGISAGVHYLASLLARYPGDVERAIASYNAGPSSRPFKNPSYIASVLGFWRAYSGSVVRAAPAVGAIALLGLTLWWASRRRAHA